VIDVTAVTAVTCCVQLCPKGDWRALMEPTRQAARQLAHQGLIEITQKGQVGVKMHSPKCKQKGGCSAMPSTAEER
jgi:hypothetical protein